MSYRSITNSGPNKHRKSLTAQEDLGKIIDVVRRNLCFLDV